MLTGKGVVIIMIDVNKNTFNAEVLLVTDKPVLVDFWASSCPPCRILSPLFEKWSQNHPEAKFVKVNIDDDHSLAVEYSVHAIPTVLLFKNGVIVQRWVGIPSESAIVEVLAKK